MVLVPDSRIKDIFVPKASGATANPGIRERYVQMGGEGWK